MTKSSAPYWIFISALLVLGILNAIAAMTDDESSDQIVQILAYVNICMAINNCVAAILFLFPAFSFVFNRRNCAYKTKYKDEEKDERNEDKEKPERADTGESEDEDEENAESADTGEREDKDKETGESADIGESEDKETAENQVEYWDKGKDPNSYGCAHHFPRGYLSVTWAIIFGNSVVLLTKYPDEEPVNMSYVMVIINCIVDVPMVVCAYFLPRP